MSTRILKWLPLCACLTLLLILGVTLTAVATEAGEIITVCPLPGVGCDYNAIQEAIDNASPGDTIRVAQGTYTENLTIDKPLTLEGGYESGGWTRDVALHETTIDGSHSRTVWGDWDGNQVLRPAVISDGAEYKMWFDGFNLSWELAIGLATSSDGTSWTKYLDNPVLTGEAGTWDGESEEHTPFVLKEDGIYKMWYEGGDGDVRQMGYATSTNGIDWSKYPGNPVVEAGPEGYDQETAGHGSVLKEAGVYELWYHAEGDQGAIIARATSPDGLDWTKHGPVLLSDPAGWDDDALWSPSVLKVDGTYWMWYSACCWDERLAVGVVTSTSGITWTRFLAAPVVTDTGWLANPHVIRDGGRFKMWYHVWHDGTGDIAYAESEDGIHWTKSASNPVLLPGTAGQWGQPVVRFVDGSDGSVLDGLTVRNGESQRGGGVLIDGSLVEVRNCTVMDNTAHEAGGGILLVGNSKAVVKSNYILSNSVPSGLGSGVCIDSSEVLLDSNLIAYNACTAWEHGDGAIGIAMEGPSVPVTVTNNVVVSNTDKGMMIADGVHSLKVVNNTIASNRNEGILAWGTISVTSLSNNIVAGQGYCGIAGAAGADFQSIDHNNVWGNNGEGGNYCDYSGSVSPPAPGPNDISADPRFVDPEKGDYRLRFDSPCIDAGTPVGAPATDIEGTARGPSPDMGAYEWHASRVFLPLVLKNHSSEPRWSLNVQINDDPGTATQWVPSIALDGSGNVHAAWMDLRDDPDGRCDSESCNSFIYSSLWSGGSWSDNTKGPGSVALPPEVPTCEFAVDSIGDAYAVWDDYRNGHYDIFFAYRPLGGSWSPAVRVNDDMTSTVQRAPAIGVDGAGNAYGVWRDARDATGWLADVYFSRRPTSGIWQGNEIVNDIALSVSPFAYPAIAVTPSGAVHAIWTDEFALRHAYRPPGGIWGDSTLVTDASGGTDEPAIAVDLSENAYAVWVDLRSGSADIYFSYRPAGGSWTANVKVNDDAGTAWQASPAIAVDGSGNAFAVWQDHRSGNGDIYFSDRPAGGTWSTNIRINDDSGTASQQFPAIAADADGNAYVVWQDGRNANGDIYFSYRSRP